MTPDPTPTKDIDEPTDPRDAVVEAARDVISAHDISSKYGSVVQDAALVNLRRALEALDD